MAYFYTCRGCKFDDGNCQKKAGVRATIKGLGITSLKMRCGEREGHFQLGQRVSFPWRVFGEMDQYGDPDETQATFLGTIGWEASPTKYVVRVDSGKCVRMADAEWDKVTAESTFTSPNLIIKVKTSDLSLTDDPPKDMCLSCLRYDDEDGCHGYGMLGHWDSYWPTECPRKPDAKSEAG